MMIVDVFDWILRITGIISIILVIFSIIVTRKNYEANINIRRIRDRVDLDLKYYDEYIDAGINGELTIFEPMGSNIKKLEVFSVRFDGKKLVDDECLKSFHNVPPNVGVLFDIYYAEGIPSRKLVWTCEYGVKGEHLFAENGFNGIVDTLQFCYRYTIVNNIRKAIGWK